MDILVKRLFGPLAALGGVLVVGTLGYKILAAYDAPFFDCLYMTVITIATIGYGEIVNLDNNVPGRVFTMFIAFAGAGILTYFLSMVTAFIIEGDLTESFRRRKMEKLAQSLQDHYIVCGLGHLGTNIVNELKQTMRQFVVVDLDENTVKAYAPADEIIFVRGDATDNAVLLKAGIEKAAGLFASTGEDNLDLVISLTARQLNSKLRIVSTCTDPKNAPKMKAAGADAVISPDLIGGLRMASEMVRPTVVSFLDEMLRDREKGLRIEEATVPDGLMGKPLSVLNLHRFPRLLLLAVRRGREWTYSPPGTYLLNQGDILIFMSPPDDRQAMLKFLETLPDLQK
jgi:voltage-gated potassium channel